MFHFSAIWITQDEVMHSLCIIADDQAGATDILFKHLKEDGEVPRALVLKGVRV